MGDAVVATLRFQREAMLRHEAGAVLGRDPDEVHDMRVAIRRIRSALRLFAPVLRKDKASSLRKWLGTTGRILGRVRDLDVMRAGLADWGPGGDGLATFMVAFASEDDCARQALIGHVSSPTYSAFSVILDEALERPRRLLRAAATDRVAAVIPGRLERCRGRFVAAGEEALAAATEPKLLHRLRIEAKRLRYGLEFFDVGGGPTAAVAIDGLVGLQDLLGALNDLDFATATLTSYLGTGSLADGAPAVPVEDAGATRALRLAGARYEELLATFPASWTRLLDRGLIADVDAAIAALRDAA